MTTQSLLNVYLAAVVYSNVLTDTNEQPMFGSYEVENTTQMWPEVTIYMVPRDVVLKATEDHAKIVPEAHFSLQMAVHKRDR